MKIDKKLLQKQEKIPRVKVGYPSPKDGSDGDMQIRAVPNKGLFLFYKYGNNWYGSRMVKSSEIKNPREESRIIVNPNNFNTAEGEIYKSGDDIKIKIDSDNSHTLGKSSSRILRDVDGGDPQWEMGSSDTELFRLIAKYDGGKGLDKVQFISLTEGSSADDGAFEFYVDGSGGANKKLTVGDTVSVIGQLATTGVLSSADIIANATKKITLDGASGHTYIVEDADDNMQFTVGGEEILNITEVGGGANKVSIESGAVFALDGGGDTFIHEDTADRIKMWAGNDLLLTLWENGDTGNLITFGGSAGFTKGSTTYSVNTITTSGGTDDTDVDFRQTNKQYLELTGNVNDLNLIFPDHSGNFTLLLKQDGSTRTVANYYSWDQAVGNKTAIKFPGGTSPNLTDGGNKIDILSFFWDNDNHITYAVATLDF